MSKKVLLIYGIVFAGMFLQSFVWAEEPAGQPDFNPENNALIYVYGGYSYAQWKMISVSSLGSLFGDKKLSGLDYKHEATPFIVKKYGLKSNFLIFSNNSLGSKGLVK